jgi:glycosyltransferase involved in cell wall biosynthesis
LAYWGHGANFQKNKTWGLREYWKRKFVNKVGWWFAYTQATVEILLAAGFPKNRITCLNNAIDNRTFQNDLDNVSEEALGLLKRELNIPKNGYVGLYCGSLYPEKRLDFLVQACDLIQQRIPDFHLIVIGDGPSATDVKRYLETRPWAHWVGKKTGGEKATYYKLSSVILNPGLVGLHVLDAFCAGLPLISTANAKHSPEVVYLEHGVNGYLTGDSISEYADSVVRLYGDKALYLSMKRAALNAAQKYTLDNMTNNFVDGINKYLNRKA